MSVLKHTDEVARVQSSHTMRNDIDVLSGGFSPDLLVKRFCSFFNAARARNCRGDDLDIVLAHSIGNPTPIGNTGQQIAHQSQLIESHQSMSEDDWVLWRIVMILEIGKVIANHGP